MGGRSSCPGDTRCTRAATEGSSALRMGHAAAATSDTSVAAWWQSQSVQAPWAVGAEGSPSSPMSSATAAACAVCPAAAREASPKSCPAQAATTPTFIKNTNSTTAISRVESRRRESTAVVEGRDTPPVWRQGQCYTISLRCCPWTIRARWTRSGYFLSASAGAWASCRASNSLTANTSWSPWPPINSTYTSTSLPVWTSVFSGASRTAWIGIQ